MKDKTVILGSIFSAIAASICCIGPLVFVALGLGGFTAAALFESWRPYLLAVTFGLLGLGFYLAYHKPKGSCADGPVCASNSTETSRHNKIFLWIATVLVLVFAAFPYYSGSLSGALHRQPTSVADRTSGQMPVNHSESVTMKVRGMTCGGCASLVQASLEKLSGVKSAVVSFESSEAQVVYDPSRVTVEKLGMAVGQAGFKAELPTSNRKKGD